jgi:hypothetical protein
VVPFLKDIVPPAAEGVTTAVSVTFEPQVVVESATAGVACSPTESVFVKTSPVTAKVAVVAVLEL